jgi:hypothetical protein
MSSQSTAPSQLTSQPPTHPLQLPLMQSKTMASSLEFTNPSLFTFASHRHVTSSSPGIMVAKKKVEEAPSSMNVSAATQLIL